MRLIAQRGFGADHPENTLQAVAAAGRRADGVTIDVRRCDSGELVAIRDPTVDRLTDGSGAVCRHTLSELRTLALDGTDAQIPTLPEVFETVPAAVGVILELHEVGLAADVLRLADRAGSHVTVSSGIANELEGCRGIDPAVPRAYRFDNDPDVGFHFARETECSFLHPSAAVCDDALVTRAHEAGFCVNGWGVDSPAAADRLAAAGVDGVVAHRPLTRARHRSD